MLAMQQMRVTVRCARRTLRQRTRASPPSWRPCTASTSRRERLLGKCDVAEFRPGGGNGYATRDGFGWTKATHIALRNCALVIGATK